VQVAGWRPAVGALVVAIVWLLATGLLFVRPPATEAQPADAVVLLAGGRGERLEAALGLMELHVAPTLVLSSGTTPRWPAANRVCAARQPFEVLCPRPHPSTTIGEARMIGDLAEERGWQRITLVTSTYHALRGRLLVGLCVDGEVAVVAARPRQPAWRVWTLAAREQLALVQGLLLDRPC
jgi:uncharacterized SAM-binding protein YcdF (DUF218 family)